MPFDRSKLKEALKKSKDEKAAVYDDFKRTMLIICNFHCLADIEKEIQTAFAEYTHAYGTSKVSAVDWLCQKSPYYDRDTYMWYTEPSGVLLLDLEKQIKNLTKL